MLSTIDKNNHLAGTTPSTEIACVGTPPPPARPQMDTGRPLNPTFYSLRYFIWLAHQSFQWNFPSEDDMFSSLAAAFVLKTLQVWAGQRPKKIWVPSEPAFTNPLIFYSKYHADLLSIVPWFFKYFIVILLLVYTLNKKILHISTW
jgi:hypothetical protein